MKQLLRSRKIVVALSMALFLTACSAIAELSPMTDTGEAFMKAMKSKDNAASYALLAAPLQKEIGGVEGWAQFTDPRTPKDWTFTNKSVSNGDGKIEGSANFVNGQHLDLILTLVKEGSTWKVTGIHFGQ
ncbi:MAG TPA: hypothetical protein VGL53_21175 [Bryobacteraceae bacterium]|jgi:hypothetical protein